jgi:hypothetical protein
MSIISHLIFALCFGLALCLAKYPECDYRFASSVEPGITLASSSASLVGYEDVLEELNSLLIKPLDSPADWTGLLASGRGIMLYGPPGTGKTFMLRQMVDQLVDAGYKVWKISRNDLGRRLGWAKAGSGWLAFLTRPKGTARGRLS